MSKKGKPRFHVGQWVLVKATCSVHYDEDQHKRVHRETTTTPFVGVVVGARKRFLGRYVHACYPNDACYPDGGSDPPYLAVDSSVLVWLVTRGVTNQPVEVLEQDLEPATEQLIPKGAELPWRYVNGLPWDDRSRKEWSEAAKQQPRERGRFVKASK
jgi:hypothetical protein